MKKITITLESKNPYDLVRHTWGFRPVTRVVGNGKAYNRKRAKAEFKRGMND